MPSRNTRRTGAGHLGAGPAGAGAWVDDRISPRRRHRRALHSPAPAATQGRPLVAAHMLRALRRGALGSSYYELNFAPSGEWAAYAFRHYREGTPLDLDPVPTVAVRRAVTRFELDAIVHLDRLSCVSPQAPLQLAVSAVIEDRHGNLSFWALRHPPWQAGLPSSRWLCTADPIPGRG